jgi:hypothetical protein
MNDVDEQKIRPTRRSVAGRDVNQGPSPEDLLWESELVQLLSSLESLRSRLEDSCVAGQAIAALDTMLTMGDQVTTFAAGHLDPADEGGCLAALQAQSYVFIAAAKGLRDRLQRTTIKAILRLFGRHSEGGDPHAQFVLSAEALLAFLEEAFALFTDCFRSEEAGRGWVETHTVFIAELRGLVDKLRP